MVTPMALACSFTASERAIIGIDDGQIPPTARRTTHGSGSVYSTRRGEQLAIADVDLVAGEHARNRDDERELGQRTLVVVAHGEHGPVAVADQRDLRGLVEELRVRLAHEEPAEGVGPRGGGGQGEGQE